MSLTSVSRDDVPATDSVSLSEIRTALEGLPPDQSREIMNFLVERHRAQESRLAAIIRGWSRRPLHGLTAAVLAFAFGALCVGRNVPIPGGPTGLISAVALLVAVFMGPDYIRAVRGESTGTGATSDPPASGSDPEDAPRIRRVR